MKTHSRTHTAASRGVAESAAAKSTGLAATAVAAAMLFAAGAADATPPQRSSEGPWAKGRVLVMPKSGLPESELDKIVGVPGASARRIGTNGLYLVELPPNASERSVVARLANNPHLKFAELDQQVQLAATANDPYFGSAWHLNRISVPTAWDKTQGSGVTIAILDSGIDAGHADLSSRLVAGWNFYDNNSNTADVHGHGTGVAGAAAATTNNGTGVASVAGQARIMPIRIADSAATGYISMIAQGITWAADQGARVINISYDRLWTFSSVVSAADYAKKKGTVVIVAAGNRGAEEPAANVSTMIPVSAVDRNDVLTSWSSWGSHVALSAPGLDIWSTTRGGGYGAWWGTSVASPVTAGVAALVMAANPQLTSSQVESILYSTSSDLGPAGRDKYYGFGRIDASAAVKAALATTATPSDTQAPSVSILNPLASSTVTGTVPVSVEASDNVGVSKIELRVNGGLVSTDTITPFGFSWDSTKVGNGTANLEARAYDAAGNVASSNVVPVSVANAADLAAPTVAISSPLNGAKVSGTVSVKVAANDNSGVTGLKLELLINSRIVASSTGTGSLAYNWNTRKWAAGTYTLTARATDAAGNVTSSSISVQR